MGAAAFHVCQRRFIPYETTLESLKAALRRSGTTAQEGVNLTLRLEAEIEKGETRRLGQGDLVPTHAESTCILRAASAKLTEEYKKVEIFLAAATAAAAAAADDLATPQTTAQWLTPKPPRSSRATPSVRLASVEMSAICLNMVDIGGQVKGTHNMSPQDQSDWVTYSAPGDDDNAESLLYSIEACLNLESNRPVQVNLINLTDARNNEKFSEETAQKVDLPTCSVCGYFGHCCKFPSSVCRMVNSKKQLVLNAVAMAMPLRRPALWAQMRERGVLKDLPEQDVNQLWDIVCAKAEARDAKWRAAAPQFRKAGQYQSQMRSASASPFGGTNGPGRFGIGKDEAGRPTSLRDPQRRTMAPIHGANGSKWKRQDARIPPGASRPGAQQMADLATMREQFPHFPYVPHAVAQALPGNHPQRERMILVATEAEAQARGGGVPATGRVMEGATIPVPLGP
jgi:hypothetical protein